MMCGIAGIVTDKRVDYRVLFDMVASIRHRGPDDMKFYIDGNIGFGHARLSIIDIENGIQPITNENGSVVVIFNGEIFNYLEIRGELTKENHVISNNSDSSILPHMYEQYGIKMFERLNGQFAIAIWDKTKEKLILARDRMGEKPLYYFCEKETICFASEIKAILKSGLVVPTISPTALGHVFTYWSTLNGSSVFKDIFSIPPGCYMIFESGNVAITPFFLFSYYDTYTVNNKDENYFINELETRLVNSVKRRMIADVPISFYLSGGLDSSIITSIAANIAEDSLNTFSITFEDKEFDESKYQKMMSGYLRTKHHEIKFSMAELPSIIKRVVYHTETPLLRAGAFPMYALAEFVRNNNKQVVLSGEGSDELFGGYDIFREVKVREFCNRNPDSKVRQLLYKKINNFVKDLNKQPASSLAMFYSSSQKFSPFESHLPRWRLGAYSQQFFSEEYKTAIREFDAEKSVENTLLPVNLSNFTPVQRAQYIEIVVFLQNYLLSSQGDRVSMANGVECRYPFLDNEIVDFASGLPDSLKIRALNEKYILKSLAKKYVPEDIINRKKFPYRSPVNIPGLMKDEYVRYIVGRDKLKEYGVFSPDATDKYFLSLVRKQSISEKDVMLFLGILTTQVLVEQLIV